MLYTPYRVMNASIVSLIDVFVVIDLLLRSLRLRFLLSMGDSLCWPSSCPGVVNCTYHHWFRPYSKHRRYRQLPVSGRGMQRFLQFRLSSHSLPIAIGRFAGAQHVARAERIYSHCVSGSLTDQLHLVHKRPSFAATVC